MTLSSSPTRPSIASALSAALAAALLAVLDASTVMAASVQRAYDKTPHPHSDILAMAEVAAMDAAMAEGLTDIEVRVRPLDQRLRPALCDQPLNIVRPNNGSVLGPVSYGVQCTGSLPWTLYLRADVSAAIDLPVLQRSLGRGDIISERDIAVVTRRITTRSNDLITDPGQLIGMELKRPVSSGSPLRHGQVDYPVLVRRGQTVTLIAGGEGLEVRMQGKAMGNGAAGDRLVVTNLNSGRRVEGIVARDGSVQIP